MISAFKGLVTQPGNTPWAAGGSVLNQPYYRIVNLKRVDYATLSSLEERWSDTWNITMSHAKPSDCLLDQLRSPALFVLELQCFGLHLPLLRLTTPFL